VDPDALQRRLPEGWTAAPPTDGPHTGANLMLVFSEVLLRQDAGGQPAPDAADLSVAFLVQAVHARTGELASFILRTLTANPAAVPGRFRVAVNATASRVRALEGDGLRTTVTDEIALHCAGGGVALRVHYVQGIPVRMRWTTTLRSAADPTLARAYQSEALIDVVWSEPAGIARALDTQLQVTDAAVRDLFDGSERMVSVTVVPWFFREEFAVE
jgi:hypothetical protein